MLSKDCTEKLDSNNSNSSFEYLNVLLLSRCECVCILIRSSCLDYLCQILFVDSSIVFANEPATTLVFFNSTCGPMIYDAERDFFFVN